MARSSNNRRVLPAQEPLWETHYRRFLRKVRCPEVAADLLQQLRLKIHERMARHGEPEDLARFAAVSARSVFVDWLREKQRRPDAVADDALTQEVPDHGTDVYASVARVAWLAEVRAELDAATSSEMMRVVLARWDEPCVAVAEALGSTASAVRTYRHKLHRRLTRNQRLRTLALEKP